MPRRTRANSKRRSLIFTESPLNASKAYCSPVVGADHPVTADTVQIDDEFDLGWVSPQFNPNNKDSAPRRKRRNTRNRAACSGPSTTSQRPLLRKDVLPGGSNEVSSARPKGFTALMFIGDKDTKQQESSNENTRPCVRSKKQTDRQNVKSRRTVAKCYGGRPMNCSVNQTLDPDELNVRHGKPNGHRGDEQVAHDRLGGIHSNQEEIHVPEDVDDPKENMNGLRRSFRIIKQHSSDDSSCSPKFKRKSRTRLRYPKQTSDKTLSNPETDNDSDRVLMSPSNLDHEVGLITERVSHRLLREPNTSTVPGRILACDTPESEYGLRVSLRRRKDLLPLPARNKLLCP